MEDHQIIELYWERNPGAIEASAKKYNSYCFAVANNILNNREDSEECVNDTWFQSWKSMPPHRPDFLRMFFAKITRSLAFNRWKANTADKRGGGELPLVLEELAECISDGTNLENEVLDQVIARELSSSIRNFVMELPVREGDIFLRRYFFGESIREIGKNYGLTANHTTVLLSRARKKLREHLVKEGYLYE